jgi:hypothetical protein
MTLSLREKILIYLLVLVLAVFSIYKFVYTYVSADYETNKTMLVSLTQQNNLRRELYTKYAAIDTTIAEAAEKADQAADPFFPSLEPEKLNLWLDGYVSKAGLALGSIIISEPTVAPIGEVSNITYDYNYPIKDYADAFLLPQDNPEDAAASDAPSDDGAVPADQSEEGMQEDAVLGSIVNISLSGPVSGLNTFSDEILSCGKTVMIRSMSYSYGTDADADADQAAISLTLVFYAVPKAADPVFS